MLWKQSGFQHALIEYARNVLNLAEADHAETNPEAALPLIAPLACSLVEVSDDIIFQPEPERSAFNDVAHPLIVAYVRAVLAYKRASGHVI